MKGRKVCRHCPEPTAEEIEAAAEVEKNGGTLTAYELAHSNAFSTAGLCWSRSRANAAIREEQAKGKWLGAHAHADGHVYVPREA